MIDKKKKVLLTEAYNYLIDNIECMNDESFENLIYFICFLFKCDGNMEYNKYIYDKNGQKEFEAIMYSAMKLYKRDSISSKRINRTYDRFVSEIKDNNKESSLDTLRVIKDSALTSLGYDEVNEANALEVYEEIARVQKNKRHIKSR